MNSDDNNVFSNSILIKISGDITECLFYHYLIDHFRNSVTDGICCCKLNFGSIKLFISNTTFTTNFTVRSDHFTDLRSYGIHWFNTSGRLSYQYANAYITFLNLGYRYICAYCTLCFSYAL